MSADWTPTGRAEPFAESNRAALDHGAYSARAIAERAAVVHDELLAECPWLNEQRYMPSLHRYLQATAREQLAHEALNSRDPAKPGWGRLLEAATAASRLAWSMGAELGLTPAGHARLKLLVAGAVEAEASLADLAAEGAEIRRRRDAEDAAEAVGDAEEIAAVAAETPQTAADGEIVDAGSFLSDSDDLGVDRLARSGATPGCPSEVSS